MNKRYFNGRLIGFMAEKLNLKQVDDLVRKAQNGDSEYIDARPSDCIAVAVRCTAPIYVKETILDGVADVSQ